MCACIAANFQLVTNSLLHRYLHVKKILFLDLGVSKVCYSSCKQLLNRMLFYNQSNPNTQIYKIINIIINNDRGKKKRNKISFDCYNVTCVCSFYEIVVR